MLEVLAISLPVLLGLGILLGRHFAAKSENKLDDAAVALLEANKEAIVKSIDDFLKKKSSKEGEPK
jgi:hypothetical protein